MHINKNTIIIGKKVVLVPYKEEHVLRYHEWMKSEELQLLTASEPLTLDEEYAMQKSWLMDNNKCTFIVLAKSKYDETGNELESMIGDTNLFFANEDDRLCAEIEIMIAENWARGKKCGWEATLLMLMYGVHTLGVKQYLAKISYINTISINMFKNMGFVELSKSDVFQEITLAKVVDDVWLQWLKTCLGQFIIKDGISEEII